ncbi:MAG: T9SS type A sorting domain-containing protein [Flavobacteriales bacterium]|nr:T9SS type A sorting domain-containing protein [Flavobacteriales bacterium]
MLLLSLIGPLQAQEDTTRVQTLTYDSITTRRGWFQFPDDTHTYRKVLMHHTLKCDPQTTQDQYNCGEWDYLTYNFVHEHTGALDSTALQHPLFKVGATVPPAVERAPVPFYHTRQLEAARRTITGTLSETSHTVGSGGAWDNGLLQAQLGTSRSQFLFLASELTASGLQPGAIHQLRLTTDAQGSGAFARFTIRMKNTPATTLSTFDGTGLVTVHEVPPTSLGLVAGEQVFVLSEAFAWDGISNVLVDLAASRPAGGNVPGVLSSQSAPGMALQAIGRDGYLTVGNDFIALDATPMDNLGTAITVMFWVKGDTIIPTVNSTIFEAVDAQDRRILNVHLPWSDGRVYWDAGNDGGGFDRIDKATTPAEAEGQWNHWAFMKNTATGQMKIYLNGVLWHSGTGKTKPLSGISEFRFASGRDGEYPYPGLLDEINVFNAEVDAATIAAWKDRAVDGTHPYAADLLYTFHCDELPNEHVLMNSADGLYGAWPMGTVQRAYRDAPDITFTAQPIATRPDLTFVQGDYTSVLDTLLLERQEPLPLLTEEYFEVTGNSTTAFDTVFAWSGGTIYTYGPDGAAIDSSLASSTTDVNDTLDYFGAPYEVVKDFEIGRYITPYGIGLSLGPQGFRWTYDVTDYQWLLHDSVELSAGNQQELIDLEFEMIEGTPPRTVVNHQRPWGGLTSRSYADLDNDVALPEVQVQLDPTASQWSLRTRLTGHGHNSNNGEYPHCCEWKDNTHYLDLNGAQLDAWHIWQENDCALNPVYPQGGTWLGSREGWCPGDVVKDHSVELPGLSGGGTAQLDYRITPVPANNQGMGGGNYVVNMDLFEYGAAAHQLDAEIVEVKRPSNVDYHRRDNPICYDPLLVLRNAGAQDLTSVNFTYGVSGGAPQSWTWTGLLKHMEQVDVLLPINDAGFWLGDSANVFTVGIAAANGAADQHAANDSYRTTFTMPTVYAENFIVNYKTNNRPQENSLTIRDVYGNVVFGRNSHTANTTYSDTMALFAGCYTIEFLDNGNDGLSYWADPAAGSGFFRLRRTTGTILKNFEAEFGRKIHWPFTIGALVGQDELLAPATLAAFPNPTNGIVHITTSGLQGPATIEVRDARGRSVQRRQVEVHGDTRLDLDLGHEANGLYHVRITSEDGSAQLRIVKQ